MLRNPPLLMIMLIIGCSALTISLTMQLSVILNWILLILACVLNIVSAIGLFRIAVNK